jgi:hypothetical protein
MSAFFGAGGGEMTTERARELLTKDAFELLDGESGTAKTNYRRSAELEHALFRRSEANPLVFVSGNPRQEMCQRLLQEQPTVAGFTPGDMRAVFFSAKSIGSGTHDEVVLATFVYGQPESGRVNILQKAATYGMLAKTSADVVTGLFEPVPVSQMREKPNLAAMLRETVSGSQERRREDEESRRKMEEKMHKQKVSEERVLSSLPSDRFLFIPGKSEYRMSIGKGGSPETVSFAVEGSSVSAPVTNPPSHYEGSAFGFRMEDPGGKAFDYNVTSDFAQNASFSEKDKKTIRRVLVSPVDGNDRLSLAKVLDLFPHDVYRSRFFENHFYSRELLDALLPLYAAAAPVRKQRFLENLLDQLREAKGITAASRASIPAWFAQHEADFQK